MSRGATPPVLPASSTRWFVALCAANLVVRAGLLLTPGYVYDVEMYARWALDAAQGGLPAVYDGSSVDYPPFFLYLLFAVGKVYLLVGPGDAGGGWLLTALVKLPHLIFDLALAALLWRLVARSGYWGAAANAGHGRTAALLYLWNPAVLWDCAWWGQPDGVHSALALGSLAATAGGRLAFAGALLAAAALMKPLAAPLIPLFALCAALRGRWAGVAAAAAGGLVAALTILLPFIATGRIVPVLRRILGDLDAMPYASVNATNLWWLLGASRDATAPWLGPLSPQFLGLTAFLMAYAVLLARNAAPLADRSTAIGDYGARLCLVGAAVAAAFFFLTTHMHENHLFLAIPLLLATAGRSRSIVWLFTGASLAVLLNGALHDLWLPTLLPPPLDALSPYADPHIHRPYTWFQVLGSTGNALLVGVVALGIFRAAWRLEPERP